MNKTIVPVLVVAVVFGAAGFFGGMQYQRSQSPSGRNFAGGNFNGAIGQGQNGARRNLQGGFSNGTVISKDDKSLTLKLNDGSSKIILYSAATQVSKQASGTADDLVVGDAVLVTGSANPDGSINAQTISLRPAGSMPGQPGGGGQGNPIPSTTTNAQ